MTGEAAHAALAGGARLRRVSRLPAGFSARQIELLRTWSRTGARLGAIRRTSCRCRPQPRSKWRLGEPDLVLAMREPFEVPASGDDIYRYFVIPTDFAEDKVVVALDFSPGDPRVVHHANYLIDYEGRARAEDAKDEDAGLLRLRDRRLSRLQRLGNRRVDAGGGALGPGSGAGDVAAAGAGIWSWRCTITWTGRATTDRSEVAFYFAREPVSTLRRRSGHRHGGPRGFRRARRTTGGASRWTSRPA